MKVTKQGSGAGGTVPNYKVEIDRNTLSTILMYARAEVTRVRKERGKEGTSHLSGLVRLLKDLGEFVNGADSRQQFIAWDGRNV